MTSRFLRLTKASGVQGNVVGHCFEAFRNADTFAVGTSKGEGLVTSPPKGGGAGHSGDMLH